MSLGNPIIPQAPSVSQAILVASASYSAASDTTGFFPVDFFNCAEISVVVTTASGSLDVYVQKQLQDGVLVDDIAHFATFTTTGATTLNFVNGGNLLNNYNTGNLASNTVITCQFGSYWRIMAKITGAAAAFNFGVFGGFEA